MSAVLSSPHFQVKYWPDGGNHKCQWTTNSHATSILEHRQQDRGGRSATYSPSGRAIELSPMLVFAVAVAAKDCRLGRTDNVAMAGECKIAQVEECCRGEGQPPGGVVNGTGGGAGAGSCVERDVPLRNELQ